MGNIKPPKGIQARNSFWVDHVERMEAHCGCDLNTPDDSGARPYDCLESDAELYAGEDEWSMPGGGSLIRAARRIHAKLSAPDSDRTIRAQEARAVARFKYNKERSPDQNEQHAARWTWEGKYHRFCPGSGPYHAGHLADWSDFTEVAIDGRTEEEIATEEDRNHKSRLARVILEIEAARIAEAKWNDEWNDER